MSKGSTTTQTTIPEWQKQQLQEIYATAKEVAGQPFTPYTGAMIAGFNPDQLRQFQATRGLFEAGIQYDPMAGLAGLASAEAPTVQPFTGYGGTTIADVQAPQFRSLLDVDIGEYQSPYQQEVIDLALGDIRREADIATQQAQQRAIGAGAFGGSRSAILEAETARPYAEQAARTASQLRQTGFEQAQRAALADIQREQQLGMFGSEQQQQRALQQASLMQQAGLAEQDIRSRLAMFAPELELRARQQQAGLLGGLGAEQMARLGLLGQMGTQQQALQQQQLAAARSEFERALAYDPERLAILQAGMGVPLTGQITKQKTGAGDVLSTTAQLLAGLFSAGVISDKRMKKDLKLLGKEDGHNIYSWNWNDKAKSMGFDKYPTIGVIAQEVMEYMPEAVSKNEDGYYMVNYGAL